MRKFILAIAFWVVTALPAWAESQEIETNNSCANYRFSGG